VLKRFPILKTALVGEICTIDEIPWAIIAPHARQALKNHEQTLERLAERGGLCASEAVAVLEDREWIDMPLTQAEARLRKLCAL